MDFGNQSKFSDSKLIRRRAFQRRHRRFDWWTALRSDDWEL